MGEKVSGETWFKTVEEVVKDLEKRIAVEAAIVFGSWARGGGGTGAT